MPRFPALLGLALTLPAAFAAPALTPIGYRVQLDVVSEGFDGKTCWFHPRAGAIPGPTPTVVLTLQEWNVKRSDVFYPVASRTSSDLGATWSPIAVHADTLGRHRVDAEREEGICDFTPKWHAGSGRLLGTGHTVFYQNDVLVPVRPRHTVWSVYDPAARTWTPWAKLAMPDLPRFANAGAGSTQRVDLPNGDILLPFYFKARGEEDYRVAVARCAFDGTDLAVREIGPELTVRGGRGLYEPSLAHVGGRFFLTLRNDTTAYVATSRDGLHFDAPRRWTWDDGTELGSYNTQAHWVTHGDALFLVYTRRGAGNDHVFRHRAPLFIAQVDPAGLVRAARHRTRAGAE